MATKRSKKIATALAVPLVATTVWAAAAAATANDGSPSVLSGQATFTVSQTLPDLTSGHASTTPTICAVRVDDPYYSSAEKGVIYNTHVTCDHATTVTVHGDMGEGLGAALSVGTSDQTQDVKANVEKTFETRLAGAPGTCDRNGYYRGFTTASGAGTSTTTHLSTVTVQVNCP